MKIVLTFIAAVFISSAFAQNFGYKKGVISVDKIPVAQLERTVKKDKKSEYIVTTLDGKKLIEMKEFWVGTAAYYHLLFLSDSSKADMQYELLAFTLNMEKSIAMQLVKQYKLFTKDGLDNSAITAMVITSKSKLDAVKSSEAKKDSVIQSVAQRQININPDNSITSQGKIIGYVEAADNFVWSVDPIKFLDANRNVVATKLNKSDFYGYFKMRDGKELKVGQQSWSTTYYKQQNVKKLVEELVSAGYY